MDDRFAPFNHAGDDAERELSSSNGHHQGSPEEWAEALARTVAHLAAQLTMSQIRLRALASELNDRGLVDEQAVQQRIAGIASAETGAYLRENLGEVLTEMIDVDTLEANIISYLEGR
jgi:hypothetical protein